MSYTEANTIKPRKLLIGSSLIAAMALSACNVESVTSGVTNARPAAVADVCKQYRAPFEQIRKERQQRVARWAAAGAAAGVAVAAAAGGNRNNLLVGLIGGALLGAASGYVADVQKRRGQTANLRAAVNSDAGTDRARTDQLVRSLTRLNSCRIGQVNAVSDAVRSGKLDRKTAVSQLRGIERLAKSDNSLIKAIVGDNSKSQNVYVGALRNAGVENPDAYVASLKAYKPRVSQPKLTSSGRAAGSLAVSGRSRPGSSVSQLGYANKDLEAINEAHVASVASVIDDLEGSVLFTQG